MCIKVLCKALLRTVWTRLARTLNEISFPIWMQIKLKPAPLPLFEPDSSEVVFGKYDMSLEKMEEAKKRAQEYAKCQLQAAADRKRAAILSQLVDQRKALDMFQRAKKQ